MIHSVIIDDIGPYEHAEAEFSAGKTVIIGENGAGKTMLLKCINMALWGGSSRYILDTTIDDFIRRGSDSGHIRLSFSIGGRECEVERTWNRNGRNEATLRTPTAEITGITNVGNEMERIFTIPSKNWIDISWAKQGEINELLSGDKDVFDRLLGIADLENAWKRLRDTVSQVKNEVESEEKLVEELSDSVKDVNETRRKIESLEREMEETKREVESIELTDEYPDQSDTISELKAIKKEKGRQMNLLLDVLDQGDLCPTCYQEIDEGHKEHIKGDIEEIEREIERIKDQLEELSELQALHNAEVEENRKKELQGTRLENDLDNKQSLKEELQSQLNRFEDRRERLKGHQKNVRKLKREKKMTEMMREAYRLSQPYLREGRINKLKYGVLSIFENLFGGRFSHFDIDNEYNMTIWDNGFQRNTKTLSGGESVALGIALRLSIVKEIGNQELLILDEPTSHLDQDRIGQLIDVIERISTDNQIFIVTHQELMNSASDNVIIIKRNAESSKIETINF